MSVPTAASPSQVLHLSLILGGQLRDADGLRLGKVDDLIVRLGSDDYPPVTGSLATIAGRPVFVPAELITTIEPGAIMIRKSPLDLQPFTRRPQEVLLKADVLDRQLINVDGARLVRTNEIEIARLEGWYRVVGVDTGPRGLFRRLMPRRFADTIQPGTFLDWASVEPFTGHVPTLRLRIPASEARSAASGGARRPCRGGIAPRGRGDPGGGSRRCRARGRRVRGARLAASSGVHRGQVRRRGGCRSCSDGKRRCRRPNQRATRGAARGCRCVACHRLSVAECGRCSATSRAPPAA